jgi:uncharacterized membrane protein (DUF373 family)
MNCNANGHPDGSGPDPDKKLNEFLKRFAHRVERGVEFGMAVIVIIAVALQIIHLIPLIGELANAPTGAELYNEFLGYVLNIVIGVEFFRLLAAPDLKVVLEVMMFAVTRHMIVEETSSLENLLTIIGIGILAYLQYFLSTSEKKHSFFLSLKKRYGSGRKDPESEEKDPDDEDADS